MEKRIKLLALKMHSESVSKSTIAMVLISYNKFIMLKRVIFSILLIGFLFNVFHDFIFYKIDPCMKTIESLSIDEPKDMSLDPLCNIHKNFHMYYIFVEKFYFIDIPVISINFPFPKNLFLKPLKIEIFKPPT